MALRSSRIELNVNRTLEDIRFSTSSDLLGERVIDFKFLAIVETSRTPLSLIAGPSHDVWTENGETNAWFGEQLDLDDATPRRQSQYGVLVEVKDAQIESVTSSKMTEVLFYASAEVDPAGNDDSDPIFRLKALPLSSELLTYLPSPPSSPRASEEDAQFLPSVEALRNLALSKEKKRKQVTGVFDEAAEIRRKARRKGGESVAAAASRVDGVNILVGQKKPKQPIKASSKETSTTITRPHSRTGSFTTLSQDNPRQPPSRSPSVSSDTRPTSRRGVVDTMNKRSGLSRMASFSEATTTEDRNKETISRLVMAGMRLYGLQQRKKTGHARRVSEMNAQASAASQDPVGPTEAAKDEEYKLIYHQTYKGTVFAFRRVMATEHLYSNPACLQDTVDKFLAMFCNDPLAPT